MDSAFESHYEVLQLTRNRPDVSTTHEGFIGNPERAPFNSEKKFVDLNFDFDYKIYQKLSEKKKCESNINEKTLIN